MTTQYCHSGAEESRTWMAPLASLEARSRGPHALEFQRNVNAAALPSPRPLKRGSAVLIKRRSQPNHGANDSEQHNNIKNDSLPASRRPPTPPPHVLPTDSNHNGRKSLQLGQHVRQVLGHTLAEVDAEIELEWAYHRDKLRKSLQTPWRPIAAA